MNCQGQRKATHVLFVLGLLISGVAAGQSPDPSAPAKTVDARRNAEAHREEWRKSRMPALTDDFGELARYRTANAELKAGPPAKDRVVFMGDSITDGWPLADYFAGKAYVNRGISGQTTPQMLIRFREDVIDLHPRVVIILAGTNDIAGNTGPMTLEEIEANYASLAELAEASNIRVIFCSVLPVNDYTPAAQDLFVLRSPEKISSLNHWLQDYCAAHKHGYADYFSDLVDEKGYLKRALAEDGLHPNPAGYKIMAPIASAAIEQALRAR